MPISAHIAPSAQTAALLKTRNFDGEGGSSFIGFGGAAFWFCEKSPFEYAIPTPIQMIRIKIMNKNHLFLIFGLKYKILKIRVINIRDL